MKTLRLYGAGLLVALLLTLTACVPSTRGSGGGGGSPGFTLVLDSTSLTVQQGSSGTTRLAIGVWDRSIETVKLSLVGAPSGVSSSFTIESDRMFSDVIVLIVRLTVSVDSGVAPGTYNLQVQAISGSLTKTANLTLTVSAPGGGGGGGGSGAGTTWTLRNLGDSLNGVTYGNGLFVAVGEGGTILTSRDGVTWTQRTSGTSNDLYSVTYGNGLFVAVGAKGTILTSPDGVSWTARASGTDEWLWGVAYGNSTFVAVGGGGAILTSPDGVTWTQRTSLEKSDLLSVVYGNGRFVAVGGGTILTSP